eukprot:11318044-Karenia_brevis.AAC.1
MSDRPTWLALWQGACPLEVNSLELGEFKHGWQYYASEALEQREHESLLGALRGRSRIGPLPRPACLRSCSGPFWLTVAPTSQQL